MIAQIQLLGLSNPHYARQVLLEKKEIIREFCDAIDPILLENGGGFRDLEVRILETRGGTVVILHLIVDTQDAMGANAVNSMAESLAPKIEEWTGGRVILEFFPIWLTEDSPGPGRYGIWKILEENRCGMTCWPLLCLPKPIPTAP